MRKDIARRYSEAVLFQFLASLGDGDPKHLRSAYVLWVATAIFGAVVVVSISVAFEVRRRRRARMAKLATQKRPRPIKDAWEEAGRRAEPIRMDEPPPETLEDDR